MGISDKLITNPKNKSVNSSITNEELNKLFRATHEKLKNNKPFQHSDPLVSIGDKNIKVNINNEEILNVSDFSSKTKFSIEMLMHRTNKYYADYENYIQLALDILANPSFTNDEGRIDTAIKNLNELKENIKLSGHENPNITDFDRNKNEFDEIVGLLITTLENAKKTNPTTTANQFNEW